MNWLRNKLRSWLGIKSLQSEIESNYKKSSVMINSIDSGLLKLEKQFNKHTRTDIDLNLGRYGSYIIISGKWRNNDHVEVIRIDNDEFDQVMEYVKDIRRWNGQKNYRVDVPYEYKGMF